METLPTEITLDIAKTMSAAECLALARSSKQYAWLLNEKVLWKHLAVRDLKFPEKLFDEQLDETSPAQLYLHLSRCQHQYSFICGAIIFIKICGKPIFPGTPYCRDHCGNYRIRICPQCHNDLVNVFDSKIDLDILNEDICFACQKLACKDVKIKVRPMRNWPDHFMLINTPLRGVVVRYLEDGKIEAFGPIDQTSSCGESLARLTAREKELAAILGLVTSK